MRTLEFSNIWVLQSLIGLAKNVKMSIVKLGFVNPRLNFEGLRRPRV